MRYNVSLIPLGDYCYRGTRVCPYLRKNSKKPKQENGYCEFLNLGDWETNGISLLWDQCKECGENKNDAIDEYDMSDDVSGVLFIYDKENYEV